MIRSNPGLVLLVTGAVRTGAPDASLRSESVNMAISSINQRDLIDRNLGHANPMFDFLSGFMPDTLKDLFRWCDYLYFNNSNIYAGLTKLAAYIVTDLTYDTDNSVLRAQQKDLFEKRLRIKPFLKAALRDLKLYGNSFVTALGRITRFFCCPECAVTTSLSKLKFKFDANKISLSIKCRDCNATTNGVRLSSPMLSEHTVKSADGIRIKRWDPQHIDIHCNRVTGETEYWYNFPSSIATRVKRGDPLHIANMPAEVIKAICTDKPFKFDRDSLYHMRIDAPAGVDDVWGMPIVVAALKKHYYAAVLRKANEAIALDFLVPLRVLYPETTTGKDPFAVMGMDTFRQAITSAVKAHRRDQLHTLVSPIGVGVAQLGGQGRALLTLGELQQAEDEVIACIGIPREFIYGGLSFTGTSVSLRMLENQLLSDKTDALGLLNWIGFRCAEIMNRELVPMDIVPFKFVDDVQQKQMDLSVHAQLGGAYLSARAIAEANGRDIDQLRRERKDDAIAEAKLAREINQMVAAIEADLAMSSEMQAQTQRGDGLAYDQQAVLAAAEPTVQELMQMDHSQRRSTLASLQSEDFVMYSVVVQRLAQARRQNGGQGGAEEAPV